MLPTPQIIIALGIIQLKKIVKINSKLFVSCILFLFILSFTRFQYIYYHYYPQEFASEWLTGYAPLVKALQPLESQYQKIAVTPQFNRPYIYFLFYDQVDPAFFQTEAQTKRTGDAFGFFDVHGFGKYDFNPIDLEHPQPHILYAVGATAVPDGYELVRAIPDFTGKNQFIIIKKS